MAQRDDNACEESLRAQVAQLSATLQERESTIARLVNENQRLNLAIAALRDSRWQKLGDLLRQRPFGIAELRAVLRLGGGLARTRIAPSDGRAPAAIESPPIAAAPAPPVVAPYVVRLPQGAENQAACRARHRQFHERRFPRLVVDLVEGLGDRYDQRVLTSFIPNPVAFVGIPVKELRLDAPKRRSPHTSGTPVPSSFTCITGAAPTNPGTGAHSRR